MFDITIIAIFDNRLDNTARWVTALRNASTAQGMRSVSKATWSAHARWTPLWRGLACVSHHLVQSGRRMPTHVECESVRSCRLVGGPKGLERTPLHHPHRVFHPPSGLRKGSGILHYLKHKWNQFSTYK